MRHPKVPRPADSAPPASPPRRAYELPETEGERVTALRLAAAALCHERTALRAMRHGPEIIRTMAVRERLRVAMREMGLLLEATG